MCRGVHPRMVFPADASPPTSWVVHRIIVCVPDAPHHPASQRPPHQPLQATHAQQHTCATLRASVDVHALLEHVLHTGDLSETHLGARWRCRRRCRWRWCRGGGRRRRTRRRKEQAEEDEGGGGGEEDNPAEAHLLAEDVRWRRHGVGVCNRNVESKEVGVLNLDAV